MKDTAIGFDQTEDEILAYEISDEALEIAAATGENVGNYTMFCTGIQCPG